MHLIGQADDDDVDAAKQQPKHSVAHRPHCLDFSVSLVHLSLSLADISVDSCHFDKTVTDTFLLQCIDC